MTAGRKAGVLALSGIGEIAAGATITVVFFGAFVFVIVTMMHSRDLMELALRLVRKPNASGLRKQCVQLCVMMLLAVGLVGTVAGLCWSLWLTYRGVYCIASCVLA